MTPDSLERIAALLDYHLPIPEDLADPMSRAIRSYASDLLGRSLDWHLGLPPRTQYSSSPMDARNRLIRAFAEQLPGTKNKRARQIYEALDSWLVGIPPSEFDPLEQALVRAWRELIAVPVSERQIRRLL